MSTKIRLARGGAKKRPYYRIVVTDSRQPRDGRFIEKVGTYNPLLADTDPQRVTLNAERITYWLGTGAQVTDRVALFLKRASLLPEPKAKTAKPAAKKPAAKKKAA